MKYGELTPHAQQRAVAWWRDGAGSDWDASFYVDALVEAMAPLGITVYVRSATVSTAGGKPRMTFTPEVSWQGFDGRGSGFVFRGQWQACDVNMSKLQDEYPRWTALHALAARAVAFMLRQPEGVVNVVNLRHGRGLPSIGIETDDDGEPGHCDTELQDDLEQWVKDVCQLCYGYLQDAYESDTSDEQAIESIEANEYEFDEEGERV